MSEAEKPPPIDEDDEPTVESADPEERILARRLRIKRRNEQLRREQLGENLIDVQGLDDDEISKGAKQLEESQKRLEKLRNDGFELVTNVKTASDAREMQHYMEDSDKKYSRNEKLEAEAKTSAEKFTEISERWSSANIKGVPQELHKLLVEQTKACDMVISDKNKIISQLQMDLKKNDDEYVKNLKKQAESIDLLLERMKEQAQNMTKVYRVELEQIEEAFIEERRDVLAKNRRKWDKMTRNRRENEQEFLDARFRRVDDFENQLDTLRTNDTEEYNMVKIKLETDVQILEQQLQQMKATYQLNQEKLEYNFQVLKKRDEENMITKAQQKRKITKMQDLANNLQIKLNKQQRFYKDENQNLTDEYHRIAHQYKELHKKMRKFSAADWQRFEDIWLMNEAEARKLLEKVLTADRVIQEQQLGLKWKRPQVKYADNVGPLMKPEDEDEKSAQEYVQEVISGKVPGGKDDFEVSMSTTKRLLEVLCDEGGFLVEDKLKKLLQPLEKGEKSLIKLDAIFHALHVTTAEDVKKLTSFIIRTLRAIELGIIPAKSTSGMVNNEQTSLVEDGMVNNEQGSQGCQGSRSTVEVVVSEKEEESLSLHIDDDRDIVINRNNLLFVLKSYVETHIKPQKEKQKPSLLSSFAPSLNRDTSKDEKYWKSMSNVIKKHKLQMWDALLDAFNKYHMVLTARANRLKENESLRKQNSELRVLLHQYISSKVNQELEIPPTRVLQFEAQ